MSKMAEMMEKEVPEFPPIETADPGLLWIILGVTLKCLEAEEPEDRVHALRVATVAKVALEGWIKLASEELDNVQRH